MTRTPDELGSVAAEIHRHLAQATFNADFDDFALRLFRLQFEANPAYRRLCAFEGRTPETVGHWREIPAAPAVAFKELEITTLPPERRTTVFHSSGTTSHRPSRHFHSVESLALYEASLLAWFAAHVLAGLDPEHPDRSKPLPPRSRRRLSIAALAPAPSAAPHSSLVHMFGCVLGRWGDAQSLFAGRVNPSGAWELEEGTLLAALEHWQRQGRPVVVLGTAFSFVHLVELCDARRITFHLAPGSRVMETGGYKGRSREWSRADLYAAIERILGIPDTGVIGEYGMSELSSQAYDRVCGRAEPRRFRFPPWARGVVVSPETGREVPPGSPGLLRIWDLANAWSVLAVQTGDLVVREQDGFDLIGRVPVSEPRGCSLMPA